jgi:hypothetical protein
MVANGIDSSVQSSIRRSSHLGIIYGSLQVSHSSLHCFVKQWTAWLGCWVVQRESWLLSPCGYLYWGARVRPGRPTASHKIQQEIRVSPAVHWRPLLKTLSRLWNVLWKWDSNAYIWMLWFTKCILLLPWWVSCNNMLKFRQKNLAFNT